ncbi:unnamed protein product [Tuber aestivum]|uniref:Urea transporter n=1 Tax=Tuber aestivum TaxID=59557 RepID=A0A292Q6C7_9PEZI|nr:unnamed protein product [Tuber aestivum]
MGMPPQSASNGLIYTTYAIFLIIGLSLAWRYRGQSKLEFIHSNRTQTAIPVALNFIASGECCASLGGKDGSGKHWYPMGSAILFSYPEIGTIAGVQGAITYAACSALPLMSFAILAPMVRKKVPGGFILTMWVKERYGPYAALYLSFLSVATMFLYMVAELSSLQQVISALTGLDGLPVVVVEVVVTSIYTSLGGFRISFLTDNIQGVLIAILITICSIAIGTSVEIDRSKIGPSGLTQDTLLGYQLIYILFSGILFSFMFLSSFWMRAFASKTDKDLWIGVSIAAVVIFIVLLLVSSTGFIAAWAGVWEPGMYGGLAFFLLLAELPSWVVGFTIVMVVALSCAIFDSQQSAMVSTISNDLFKNKLSLLWVRIIVLLVSIPAIVVALKSPSILRIFLISNIFSCAAMPSILLGLWDTMYFLRGVDIILAGIGGLFSVFLFGCAYYGDAKKAADLIILTSGLYANDWSVFGVFVAAPVGSLIFLALAVACRMGGVWVRCRIWGGRFDCLDKPLPREDDDGDETPGESLEDVERRKVAS